jgi:hypothetical protein
VPAGNYWFFMSGDGLNISQGTGIYDDNSLRWGPPTLPNIQNGGGDVLFTLEATNPVPVFTCTGFYSPMAVFPVKARKNRVFPLKMELFDSDEFEVEGADLLATPVLQVVFIAAGAITALDVSSEALSSGAGSEGNQFDYTTDGIWQFNLKSKNYSSKGEYMITAVSGDDAEYTIDPACVTSFVIE